MAILHAVRYFPVLGKLFDDALSEFCTVTNLSTGDQRMVQLTGRGRPILVVMEPNSLCFTTRTSVHGEAAKQKGCTCAELHNSL